MAGLAFRRSTLKGTGFCQAARRSAAAQRRRLKTRFERPDGEGKLSGEERSRSCRYGDTGEKSENQPRRNEEHEDFSGSFFVLFVSSWLIF
jgi:hypothetical protein